jgi:hypothetical protein
MVLMKTVTMSDMKKSGAVPRSPAKDHQERIGRGEYNRFARLAEPEADRGRSASIGKRARSEMEETAPQEKVSKAPRLATEKVTTAGLAHISNLEQLNKNSKNQLDAAKSALQGAREVAESCYTSDDGGEGQAFYRLTQAIEFLIDNQTTMKDMVVGAVNYSRVVNEAQDNLNKELRVEQEELVREQNKVSDQVSSVMSYAAAAQGMTAGNSRFTGLSANYKQGDRYQKPPPTEEDKAKKRIRQAIKKAEKATLLHGLDMGDVPTMNKETLSRKVTIDLHKKGKTGAQAAGYSNKEMEDMTDDMLTCASLDFMGTSTQKYENRYKKDDPNIGKFCTMPVKMIFKGKQERIMAEQHLRKLCKVKCSTPYPKGLRAMISAMIVEAKAKKANCFILAKVNMESLTVSTHASENNKWVDVGITKDIPLTLLDRFETQEADESMLEEEAEEAAAAAKITEVSKSASAL